VKQRGTQAHVFLHVRTQDRLAVAVERQIQQNLFDVVRFFRPATRDRVYDTVFSDTLLRQGLAVRIKQC